MTATYIPLEQLPKYLDPRLWDLCSAAIVMDSTFLDAPHSRKTLGKIAAWAPAAEGLEKYIEYHGLSGLTYSLYKSEDFDFTQTLVLPLKGAVVKHEQRWQAISSVLAHLNKSLEQASIPFIILKGAALACDVYSQPYQRAMADIDILVSPESAHEVRDICLGIGFAEQGSDLQNHHHLPALCVPVGSHTVMLEIHTQALSHDIGVEINLTGTLDSSRSVHVGSENFRTFDHINMLRHLCLHAFSRDQVIKLSAVVDIFRYALKYESEIEWQHLHKKYFHVINTMRCCRQLLSLPDDLLANITGPDKFLAGAGVGMLPLREYSNPALPTTIRLRQILFPSKWWQHVFYHVAPERSLIFTRYIRHPACVLKWGLSRYKQF